MPGGPVIRCDALVPVTGEHPASENTIQLTKISPHTGSIGSLAKIRASARADVRKWRSAPLQPEQDHHLRQYKRCNMTLHGETREQDRNTHRGRLITERIFSAAVNAARGGRDTTKVKREPDRHSPQHERLHATRACEAREGSTAAAPLHACSVCVVCCRKIGSLHALLCSRVLRCDSDREWGGGAAEELRCGPADECNQHALLRWLQHAGDAAPSTALCCQ